MNIKFSNQNYYKRNITLACLVSSEIGDQIREQTFRMGTRTHVLRIVQQPLSGYSSTTGFPRYDSAGYDGSSDHVLAGPQGG